MTAADRNSEAEQTKSALLFTAILTIVAGAAGLALAGTILGFDYLLRGEPDERDRLAEQRAERRRNRYEDALAWLEADRIDRARARARRRDWFEADPATRGDAPSNGETFGRVMSRGWNSTIVGLTRFGRGWRAGRDDARQRREAGEKNWWRVNRQSRPADTTDTTPGPDNSQPQATQEPQPASRPRRTDPSANDIIDAEIVPDGETTRPMGRDVVLVGKDDTDPDLNVDGYATRIEALQDEVDEARGSRSDNPSPPLSALR